MKSNKKIKQIAVIILIILSLLGINLSVNKIVKSFSDARNINSKSGDYTTVQYGEERVEGTDFVTFDAYFLKNSQKYRGEYLPYTKDRDKGYNATSKNLWIELRVLGNGSLKNAKLLFTQDNVTEKFKMLESETIAHDSVGINLNQINLKEVPNGKTVLFRVEVNANLKKFISNDNKVKLVGEYVANDGSTTPIEKEVKFTVESSVDNAIAYIAGDYNTQNRSYDEKTLAKKDGKIVINHFFNINFGNYYHIDNYKLYFDNFTTKEGVIESNIEQFNGHYPSNVEVNIGGLGASDYSVDYDNSNGKLKIRILNVGKLYSRYGTMEIRTLYPESAMDYNNEHIFNLKAKAHAIVENNPNYENPIISEEVEATSSVRYAHTPPIIEPPRIDRYYGEINPPNKDNPISRYEGENPDEDFEDWSVTWGFNIDNKDGNQE